MLKLRKMLSDILLELDFILIGWAARLDPPPQVEYQVPPVPHSFNTFKEGMTSADYCTRHDAASKLVGWYLYGDGHPLAEELVQAAQILLEDTSATSREVSLLVDAFVDQASATTDKDREDAEQREHKIYEDLATKAANPIK